MINQGTCDFMCSVVKRAQLLGVTQDEFMKLAETAWLVLTAEPTPRYQCHVAGCPANHVSKREICTKG